MKRVWLRDIETIRAAAVAIARWMTNSSSRKMGDPVHTYVTEGRLKDWADARARGEAWAMKMAYSSCGDPVHTEFAMLGSRNEGLVNRTNDGGVHDWIPGMNINYLTRSKVLRHPGDGLPQPGDPIFVMNVHGGHVCILDHIDPLPEKPMVTAWKATTHDYGQGLLEDAKQKEKELEVKVDSVGHTTMTLDGNPVMYWVDLSLLTFEESALVPDSFEGGEPDENPYAEGMFHIPEGTG